MLFLMIIVLFMTMAALVAIERGRLSIWASGMCIGLILVVLAYALIWVKSGGISRQISYVLYFTDGMKRFIQYYPISYSEMSKLLLFGKSLFLASMMFLSVTVLDPVSKGKKVILICAGIFAAVFNYVILHPDIYELYCNSQFFKEKQSDIFFAVRTAYLSYLIVCLLLIAGKYRTIKINWVRRQFQFINILTLTLSALFVIFAVLGPIQVSHFTGSHYIYSNFLYFNSQWIWLVIILSSTVLIMIGSRALWNYSRLAKQIGRPGISIDKKLKDHDAGVKMYTHGMKNELLVLRAMLRDFQEEVDLDEQGAEKLSAISAVSESMLLRMDDLYHAFKNKYMVLEEIERPSAVMDAAIQKMANTSAKMTLEVEEEYPILADSHHLSEALYNLLKNAVDSIEQKDDGEGEVRIRLYIQGQNQIFEVSDTGEGIEQKNLSKIFEPFYSSKNSKKSWGLGLLYVEQVVRGHFGEVSVESVLGEGTKIYVSIPWYRKGEVTEHGGENSGGGGRRH